MKSRKAAHTLQAYKSASEDPVEYTEDAVVTPVEEETVNYCLDESIEAYNDSLIKYEFNLIELPIFSKNDKIKDHISKKYVFSAKDNSYVRVSPSGIPSLLSNKILQEFDEIIFYAILKMSRAQNSKTVITDIYTLLSEAKIGHHGDSYKRARDSIQRLKHCTIEVSNTFYDAKSRRAGFTREFNLIQTLDIISFDKLNELSEEEYFKYKKYFNKRKIKDIIVLTINDYIMENIQYKGYLNFDTDALINIKNGTARKLYVLLMKWQGYEKKEKLIRSCRFLASRIPLSFDKKNVSGTLRILDTACAQLKRLKLIKGYRLVRSKPLAESRIDFHFFSIHDHDLVQNPKRKLIWKENQKLGAKTGHEDLQIEKVNEFDTDEVIDVDFHEKSFELPAFVKTILPPETCRNPAVVRKIMEKLDEHGNLGRKYVLEVLEYSMKKSNSAKGPDGFILKALDEGWGVTGSYSSKNKAVTSEKSIRHESASNDFNQIFKIIECLSDEEREVLRRKAKKLVLSQFERQKKKPIGVETLTKWAMVELYKEEYRN